MLSRFFYLLHIIAKYIFIVDDFLVLLYGVVFILTHDYFYT